MEAHNFELKLTLISMVQQSQFGGAPMEDPNISFSILFEVCGSLKLNEVSIDAIHLRPFTFSWWDKARALLHL